MELENFVSVYEDNFKFVYDQYFAEALMNMQNKHLVYAGQLPASLANFIIWIKQRNDVITAKIYLARQTFTVAFTCGEYPIITVYDICGNLSHKFEPESCFHPNKEDIKHIIPASLHNDIRDFPWEKCVIDERQYLYFEGNIPNVFDFYCKLRELTNIHGAYIKDGDTVLQITKFNGAKIINNYKGLNNNILYVDCFDNYSLKEKLNIINIITRYMSIKDLYELINTGYTLRDLVDYKAMRSEHIYYEMDTTLSHVMTARLSKDTVCIIKKKIIIDEKWVIILINFTDNIFTLAVMLRRTYDKMFNNFLFLNHLY